MREMTKHNLGEAYAGESQAHMRYQILRMWPKKKENLILQDFSELFLMLIGTCYKSLQDSWRSWKYC